MIVNPPSASTTILQMWWAFPRRSLIVNTTLCLKVRILGLQIITARKRSLGQGDIFKSVCQEFCSQVGGGWYPSMHWGWCPSMPCRYREGVWYPRMPCRWYPSMPCMGGGGLQDHTWGVSRPTPWGGGLCILRHWGRPPPPWTATAAGGTHPTGIHSCSFVNPALFALSLLLFPRVLKMNFCCFRLRYGIFQTESVNKVLMHTTGSSGEYALILVENISFR